MAKNPYINIYAGDPTEGEKDGFAISSDGSFSAPLSVLFDVSFPDLVDMKFPKYPSYYKVIKLAVRLEDGYAVDDSVNISVPLSLPWMLTADKPDLTARWDNTVSMGGITDVNTIFYARLRGGETSPIRGVGESGHDSSLTLNAKIFPL